MKQLFLKTLLWTVQNAGATVVSTIRVINSRPAQLFWAPAFAYLAYDALIQGGWSLLAALLFAYLAGRSTFKFLSRKPTAEETVAADTRQDDATQARDEAAEALKAEALEIVSTKIVEIDGVPTIVPARKPKGGQ